MASTKKDRSCSRRWVPRLGALMASVGLFLALACNSPFIPIPPPNPSFSPVVVPDGTGGTREEWQVASPADGRMANARVYIFNRALGAGIIVQAAGDGSYVAFPLSGERGDQIDLYWERGGSERSLTICRYLGEGLAYTPCR